MNCHEPSNCMREVEVLDKLSNFSWNFRVNEHFLLNDSVATVSVQDRVVLNNTCI
jgi:hypothetical protein